MKNVHQDFDQAPMYHAFDDNDDDLYLESHQVGVEH